MPRLNITQLSTPKTKWRVDLMSLSKSGKLRFETIGACKRESDLRIRKLERDGSLIVTGDWKKAFNQLIKKLRNNADSGIEEPSVACPVYMRRERIRISGHLWKLATTKCFGSPVTATLVPRSMEFTSNGLMEVTASKLKKQLLADINRHGAKEADGYLFAGLHGEYEPAEGIFRLHWHLLVAGGMVEVVDRLRKRRNYRSGKAASGSVRQRVRIGRKHLRHLPAPLTYLLQSWWPSRWIGKIDDGEIKRQRGRHRIPDPFHSQYLVWLDQQPLEDMVLLRKLRVTKSSLKVTA